MPVKLPALLPHRFLVGLLLVLVGCSGAERREDPPSTATATAGRPNVLVLVLDACRPDHMGAYGYARETTAAIDALARDPDAVLFRQHFVQGTWTKPSTASLFTGQFVYQHGVDMGHVPGEDRGKAVFDTQVLAEDHVTLAERLRMGGYKTFAVVKSYHLVREYGFAQGFDTYVGPREAGGDLERVEQTAELIARTPAPFFGYVHLNACHHPFRPEERDAELMEAQAGAYDEKARQAAGVDFTDAAMKRKVNEERLQLGAEDVEFLRLIYDAKLRRTDRMMVRPILEALRETGRIDDTLVVVTADHGEELYDHGGYAHGHALWNEVVHVPLIAKYPKGRRPASLPKEVDAPTQAIDLYPSILEIAGMQPVAGLPGSPSLAGRLGGYAFSEGGGSWMLVSDGEKLISSPAGSSLFDLAADPHEQIDLAAERAEDVVTLRDRAAALRRAFPASVAGAPTIEEELDDQAIEALRGLGYMK